MARDSARQAPRTVALRRFGPALLLAATLSLPAGAAARCRTAAELRALGAAARTQLGCAAASLVGFDRVGCAGPVGPRCGEGAAASLRDAALGASPSVSAVLGGSQAAIRCQLAIARASGHFAENRLRERAQGRRRTRGGRIAKDISSLCDGVFVESVGGAALPRVGGACAALTEVGRRIDGPALRRCVRASLEKIVDDVAPQAMRPNIVLILTDDQRWDTLPYMPSTFAALAGRGLVFRNAFATTPSCSPSRASIYTGLIARRHGVVANGQEGLFDPSTTLATALSGVGYETGFFGKYLNGSENQGLSVPPGWDEWNIFLEPSGGSFFRSHLNENGVIRTLDADDYSTDVLAERALSFVRKNASRPFFVVYAPYAPHDPAEPAPRHVGRHAGLPPHRPPNWREADVSLKPTWVKFFARIATPEGAMRRDQQRIRELETLLAVDEAVAALSDVLERAGLTDETVVLFASDHGIHWGEHWTGTKFSAYEESIRIPLVLRYPSRIPLPRSMSQLVANIDLAPTLADLAGASVPADIDGVSLVPLIDAHEDGVAPPWREELAIESRGGLITQPSRALRTDRWKYIEVDGPAGIEVELYDLATDPFELENLVSDPGFEANRVALAARLAAALPR